MIIQAHVSTRLINGKPAVINGLRNFQNHPSRHVILVVVPLNKINLFSKDLITFIISFISLFVRVVTESVIYIQPVIYIQLRNHHLDLLQFF